MSKKKSKNKSRSNQTSKAGKRIINWLKNHIKIVIIVFSLIIGFFLQVIPSYKEYQNIISPISSVPIFSEIELITRLNELNEKYDETNSLSAIHEIASIIYYNFYTLRIEKSDSFNNFFKNIRFANNGYDVYNPKNALLDQSLTIISTNPETTGRRYHYASKMKNLSIKEAIKSQSINHIPFDTWWEKMIIFSDGKGNTYSRKSFLTNYYIYRVKKYNFLTGKLNNIKNSHFFENTTALNSTHDIDEFYNETIRTISGEIVLSISVQQ